MTGLLPVSDGVLSAWGAQDWFLFFSARIQKLLHSCAVENVSSKDVWLLFHDTARWQSETKLINKIKRLELRQSKRSPEMGCCGWLQVRFNNLNGSHFQITPMMSCVKMNEISLCHCLWLQSFVVVRVPQIPKSLNL